MQLGITETDFFILLYKDLRVFLEVDGHGIKKNMTNKDNSNELYLELINECFSFDEPFEYKIKNKWMGSTERLSIHVFNLKASSINDVDETI